MEPGHGETLRVCMFVLTPLISAVQFHFSAFLLLRRTYLLPPPFTCQVCCQSPAERQQALSNLESHLADFLSDSKESTLFTPGERQELEEDVQQAQQHCQELLLNMETGEMRDNYPLTYTPLLQKKKRLSF